MNQGSEHSIILFDGVCNLCEMSVQFVIRNDRAGHFRFGSLQSPTAQQLLRNARYEHDALSSVLLLIEGKVYRKSRAALQICRRLDRAWPALYHLFGWVPTALADVVYDYIGARRYRWFGKKDKCWIPTPELAARFIDASQDASSGR
jgi:predicted DCC family thiol-disulfide oxidoreductase YuxK